jgi:deoxycytidine triphosphate deaminase
MDRYVSTPIFPEIRSVFPRSTFDWVVSLPNRRRIRVWFDPSDFVTNTTLGSGGIFRLRPKQFRLAQTLEKITLPAGLAAHIHGRSSLARSGLAVHSTAPHIHPGFYGPITLELFNYGEWELEFSAGKDVICQLILWEVKTPPPKSLVESLSSYRGQEKPFPKKKKR